MYSKTETEEIDSFIWKTVQEYIYLIKIVFKSEEFIDILSNLK